MVTEKQYGFSLIELMVGVALAIVTLLVLTAMLMGFNAQKKSTVGSSDAQVAGGVGAFMIERDLRRAGYGINSAPLLGCTLYLVDPDGGPSPLPLQPVVITQGATDQIAVTYSTARHGWHSTQFQSSFAYPGDLTQLDVKNPYGFNAGDLIVIGQNGVDRDADGINDCTLREVTSVSGSKLSHSGGTYNKPGGEGIAYTNQAMVYNFGLASAAELPERVTYAINANNELTVTSRATQFQPVPIGENIVMLRASYCKDAVNSPPSTINVCDETVPLTAAAWRQVIAVRFAVVARSPQRESVVVSDATVKLWPDMTLPSGAVVSGPTMTLTEEQQHYRYRVYGTLVPIRNMLWQVPSS